MRNSRELLVVVLSLLSACQPASPFASVSQTPAPSIPATAPLRPTAAITSPLPAAPGSEPTWTPWPLRRIFSIQLLGYCEGAVHGPGPGVNELSLCFESSAEYWAVSGGIEYFNVMVTRDFTSYFDPFVSHGVLEGLLPTATPWPTSTAGPSPASAPTLPASILTQTRPPWPVRPTPRPLRVITVEMEDDCGEPHSTSTPDHITLCFAPPPQPGSSAPNDYWMITITEDHAPTAKYGQLEWSTPTP